MTVKKFLGEIRAKSRDKKKRRIEKQARAMFNITAHERELWLTCNGTLVCPSSMLIDDEITSLSIIRELWVKDKMEE